jgi:excisionase family DNA binding protein
MLFGASEWLWGGPSFSEAELVCKRRQWRARAVPSMTLPGSSSIYFTMVVCAKISEPALNCIDFRRSDIVSRLKPSKLRMAEIPDRPGLDDDPWLTVQQVSEELKVHPATVRVWIKQERLRAVRAGKGFRVRRSEVDRALGADMPEPVQHGLRTAAEAQTVAAPSAAPRQIADQIITVPVAAGSES